MGTFNLQKPYFQFSDTVLISLRVRSLGYGDLWFCELYVSIFTQSYGLYRVIGRQTDRQTDGQTERQTDGRTGRQADRQKESRVSGGKLKYKQTGNI